MLPKNEPPKDNAFVGKHAQAIRHPIEFLDMLSRLTGDKRYKSIEKQVIKKVEQGEEITMQTFEDMIEERGVQKGIQKGLQEGIQTGLQTGADLKAKTVAQNMFKRGMSQEDTAALCGESLQKIQDWFEEWSK